jgi:exopolysaccharide production protein ExoZ
MFKNIQAMRGVAASIVLLIHMLATKPSTSPVMAWCGAYWFRVGPAGVDIFFVISGLVVTLAALRSAEEGRKGAIKFGLARLLRIYPIYWAVLIFAYPLAERLALSSATTAVHPLRIVLALTDSNPKVMLAWTLFFELLFYAALTGIIALAGRRFSFALWMWAIIQSAIIFLGLVPQYIELLGHLVTSPMILEFIGGAFIALLSQRWTLRYGLPTLVVGCVCFCLGVVIHHHQPNLWAHWPRTLCFGAPSVLIIYGLVSIERNAGWILPRWLQRVGDASYSLYIWHQLVFGVLLFVCKRLGLLDVVPDGVLIPVWGIIAFGWGMLSYRYLEVPLIAFSKKLLSSWAQRPVNEGGAGVQA